ncbi:MAG: TIGR04076 family protein [Deltaproteobacteria bacterium]|nr:TIGR04076 family protein [Deltaproteobacteria bacterium]
MYFKVIATVEKVSMPSSLTPGEPSHVRLPCRMYEKGDKIVFHDNQIDLSETTGALCLSLVSGMIPVVKALQRSVEPVKDPDTGKILSDSTQKVSWYTCPDAERPVIFKIERIPLKGKPGWIIAEEMAKKKPGNRIHLHACNPNDRIRKVNNNLGEKIDDYGK